MICIRKPLQPPVILTTHGLRLSRSDSQSFTRHEAAYRLGERVFNFDRKVYGDETVKRALVDAQHGKCAYCESKFRHVAYGDVEHFRPKAAVRQSASDPPVRPGYYWLAYAWSNLYFACELCNRRHKQNLFPLLDPAARAGSHRARVQMRAEQPLFIDPGREDPQHHIGWRWELPVGRDSRGQTTIDALGLTREPLGERRREHLDTMKTLLDALLALDPAENESLRSDIAHRLERACADASEFTAATRELLRDFADEVQPFGVLRRSV